MIRDLTESLGALLLAEAPAGSDLSKADVAYDRPVESFAPTRATLNLYLYDVRENLELRNNEPIVTRGGGMVTTQRPPMRVACSYLVTAWPGNVTGEELFLSEQRLLAQALLVFARFDVLPDKYLRRTLVGQDPAPPIVTAQASGMKDPSEFWTALGNKLRPSINVTVTIAMQPYLQPQTGPAVRSSVVRIGSRDPSADTGLVAATTAMTWTVGGTVSASGKGVAAAGVCMQMGACTLSTSTDADGRFRLAGIPAPGDYPVAVTAGAVNKTVTFHIPRADEKFAGTYDIAL